MGAYLNKPVTEKETESGENERVRFAATTMQGWRINQEDAHNCILNFDEDCSLFAVYDGHGGSEVARYTAMHLPDLLKSRDLWRNGEYGKAIDEAFLEFDDILRSEEVLKELKAMAGRNGGAQHEASDDEDKEALYEEAAMPLESILEKYGFSLRKDRNGKAILDLDNLHSLREQHEKLIANSDEETKEKENGSNCQEEETGNYMKEENENCVKEQDDNCQKEEEDRKEEPMEGAENGKREEEKGKKRVCESPIAESAKRTKSSEGHEKGDFDNLPVTQRRHCFSESHSSHEANLVNVEDSDRSEMARRERASKSESEATDLAKEEQRLAGAPDMRQIADECHSTEKPQPSATPETQTAVSSDSEQSVDEDYNEDEEMSEEEEEDSDPEEDEPAYNGPSGDTPGEDSGTTACVVLLFKDKIVVGNAGDSRAVLCRKGTAIELSVDHKPEDETEKSRIEAAGGEISIDGRVNGGLNLSRALGDHFYKKNDALPLKDQMISAQPDVSEHCIEPDDEFVVVACDGIWNSLTSQEVVEFVRKRISSGVALRDICEQMCSECLSPNTAGDGTGCDNMTVIIAELLRQ